MTRRTRVLHTTVYLYPDDVVLAKKLGAGNLSNGIRFALDYTTRRVYPSLFAKQSEPLEVPEQPEQI